MAKKKPAFGVKRKRYSADVGGMNVSVCFSLSVFVFLILVIFMQILAFVGSRQAIKICVWFGWSEIGNVLQGK